MNKRITTLVLFLLSVITVFGQTAPASETATDNFAGSDKFNVVAAVLCVIFVGLAIYLVIIDRKVSKLEKRRNEKKN